jgi:hypothetical protein
MVAECHSKKMFIGRYKMVQEVDLEITGVSLATWACIASLLAASSRSSVSTASLGTCTYLITLPLIKQFLTDNYPASQYKSEYQIRIRSNGTKWGYLASSNTLILLNLKFRN